MIAVMLPVDTELATDGVCWSCKDPFEFDDYYFRLTAGPVCSLATCTGCMAQLVCDPA